MHEFDLVESRVRLILRWVHWLQTGTLLVVGVLLAAAPLSRFGHSYDFLLEVPGARYVFAAVYAGTGAAMWWALIQGRKKVMGWALRIGGCNTLAFAIFLLIGAATGPTGILGPVFTQYAGAHLILQSLLLNSRE